MKTVRKIVYAAIALGLAFGAVLFAGKTAMGGTQLAVGDAAPNFTLPDQTGKSHTLSKLHGKVVVLAFYPADFTGGCTIEAHSLTAAHPDFVKLGVQVFGVSVQDSTSHAKFCQKEGINYTLLADTGRIVSSQYSGLMSPNGVANRETFIIGKDGKIVNIDSNVNSHIGTCGADWVNWLKSHPEVTR